MNTTKDELLDVINKICLESINIKTDYKPVTDSSQLLTDAGVDSLDFITVFIYIGDIWQISDDDFNKHPSIAPEVPRPLTIQDVIDSIEDLHTIDPTYNEALDQV